MQERNAVLMLLGLAVAGHGVRLMLHRTAEPPGQLLAESGDGADPARHRARAIHLSRPLDPGETVDLNSAPAEEIARLPRVGMSLAKRLVDHRETRGRFESLADLDAVYGVGPALISRLEGKVRFGGVIGKGPGRDKAPVSSSTASGYDPLPRRLNLNLATETDLRALPGIGVARARAILAYRREKGPFAAVSDLGGVPGLSQLLVHRLEPLVTVR